MKKEREATNGGGAGDDTEILEKLAERVDRAMTAVQQLRRERDELRGRLTTAEKRLKEQEDELARVADYEGDVERFRTERSEIRNRIERILDRLEDLESAAPAE